MPWEVLMIAKLLSHYWWTLLLRGTIWVLFGVTVFALPGISLVTLTLMFGAFALVDGIVHLISAFGGRRDDHHWWHLLLAGVAGIGVGILTILAPGVTALALLYYIAIWAIATGVLAIVTSIRLRREIDGEFWLATAGLAAVVFGMLLVARPGAGALTVLWLIGTFAIAFGVMLIVLGFKTRGFVNRFASAFKGSTPAVR
jgi:uncharacterized membrane protein HdeD (DUF308 family)